MWHLRAAAGRMRNRSRFKTKLRSGSRARTTLRRAQYSQGDGVFHHEWAIMDQVVGAMRGANRAIWLGPIVILASALIQRYWRSKYLGPRLLQIAVYLLPIAIQRLLYKPLPFDFLLHESPLDLSERIVKEGKPL